MNVTNYNPTRVAFEQTNCGVCRTDYTEGEKIVELACKHIFHEDCLFPEDCFISDDYCCPVCQYETIVPSRTINWSKMSCSSKLTFTVLIVAGGILITIVKSFLGLKDVELLSATDAWD